MSSHDDHENERPLSELLLRNQGNALAGFSPDEIAIDGEEVPDGWADDDWVKVWLGEQPGPEAWECEFDYGNPVG